MALQLQRALAATVDKERMLVAYGVPLPQAQAVLQRVGYQELGRLERWVKPLRSEMHLRKFLGSLWLRRPAAWIIDPVLILQTVRNDQTKASVEA